MLIKAESRATASFKSSFSTLVVAPEMAEQQIPRRGGASADPQKTETQKKEVEGFIQNVSFLKDFLAALKDQESSKTIPKEAAQTVDELKEQMKKFFIEDVAPKEPKIERPLSSDPSSSTDTDSSSTAKSSSASSVTQRRKRKVKYQKKKSSVSNIQGMDYRRAPKMEKFSEESGKDLKSYLRKFEDYCEENYRGGRDFWIGVLEDHLEGKLLNTFQLLRDNDD